ncbi:MAG TPA: hypothetical protein VJN88_05315 [Ktedonobacterales bacterium]|nr:hypothetical protein [Ktedonobacterales bacterium]
MTTFKLGYTNPLTDAFGAHPILGAALDLNDGVNYTILSPDGVKLSNVTRTVVSAGNIRSQGERGVRAIYRHPREIGVSLILGPSANYANFMNSIRQLLAWINASPNLPLTIQYQPFSASTPVYLDVIAAAHSIPDDEDMWLRLQLEPVELVFLCRPGLRGDRLSLSNLVMNPGFEGPSGGSLAPAVTVFADTFANLNAYSTLYGGGASLAANVMSVFANSAVTFGSPAWGAIQTWQIRFQWQAGLTGNFYLHYVDANNGLFVEITGANIVLYHKVAGVFHQLALGAITPTNGNRYWLVMTQFPSVAGDPPSLSAMLYNDSAGSIGSLIIAPVGVAYDAVTALSGKPAIETGGGSMAVGGVGHSNPVQYVALFGPGAWTFASTGSGIASGAWDGSVAGAPTSTNGNAYQGGPVAGQGAARIEAPPAGTFNAQWLAANNTGPAAITQTAQPLPSPGSTLGVSAWIRSVGMAASCTQQILIDEFDSGGNFLRQGTVAGASVTGTQSVWTQLAGTYVTGANCAFVALILSAVDNTNASVNGTLWLDNVQVWNQTATGQTSMPYCELRFPNAPAQLVVSGLLGDLPTPAWFAFGTYVSTFPASGILTFAIGRAAQTSRNAQLVGNSHGWYSTALSPQSTPQADASAYGGWYDQATVASGGWNPRFVSPRSSDAPGVYHVFGRFRTSQAAGNLGNVQVRATAQQRLEAWYGELTGTDQIGAYYGPYSAPIQLSNAWTTADAGQVAIPPFNAGARTDPTLSFVTPRQQWIDTTGGGSTCGLNWEALVPVDGSLLVGVLNNPSNNPYAPATNWLWSYFDGLLVNRASASDGPAWQLSVENVATPNPAHAGGGPGTQTTGTLNINSGADPYLTLDPTLAGASNILVATVTDGSGDVLAFAGEIQYSPLYLQPR